MICRSGAASEPLSELPAAGMASDRCGGDDLRGKIFQADVFAFAEQDCAFDDVLQLADVAGPAIALQCARASSVKPVTRLPESSQMRARKCVASSGMSLVRSRSGGQLEVDDVDAIEQVLAKTAGGDSLGENLVGGQDYASIDVECFGAADLLELELLQDAKELDLHAGTGGADLVEEDGAARRTA